MTSIDPVIRDLIEKEGWKISAKDGKEVILAYGEVYPVKHPLSIHLKRYRLSKNPEEKYQHMKAAHDYLWPTHIKLWHYWTERRFREHCNGWSYISYAGGAACAKSYDAAKIALLFWLSNPKGHAVIIASTTLNSLGARIWGYAMSLIRDTEMEIPFQYMRSQPPKFLYDRDDLQHGIFAAAAKLGKGRIQRSATQTIAGLSRITAATPQTILGKARVTATTTQTITGTARIVRQGLWYVLDPQDWETKNAASWFTQLSTGWETKSTSGWQSANSPTWYIKN
jgi:hypothetical protein